MEKILYEDDLIIVMLEDARLTGEVTVVHKVDRNIAVQVNGCHTSESDRIGLEVRYGVQANVKHRKSSCSLRIEG